MRTEPNPPEGLATYLEEGIPKQDTDTLEALNAWIEEIIEYRTTVPEDQIQADSDEAVESLDESADGTVVVKNVSCGKDGCKCQDGELHGPYKYIVRRKGGDLVWDYHGPVSES